MVVYNVNSVLPYIFIFNFCAYLCLLLSYYRKQSPLLSFIVGSLFGPLGIIMFLIAGKDFRAYRNEEKDEDFYNKQFSKLKLLHEKIKASSSKNFLTILFRLYSGIFFDELSIFADYFRVRPKFYDYESASKQDNFYTFHKVIKAFSEEYKEHFGHSHAGAQEMLRELDKEHSGFGEKDTQ